MKSLPPVCRQQRAVQTKPANIVPPSLLHSSHILYHATHCEFVESKGTKPVFHHLSSSSSSSLSSSFPFAPTLYPSSTISPSLLPHFASWFWVSWMNKAQRGRETGKGRASGAKELISLAEEDERDPSGASHKRGSFLPNASL